MGKYMLRLFTKNRDHFRSLALKEIGKMTKNGFITRLPALCADLSPTIW